MDEKRKRLAIEKATPAIAPVVGLWYKNAIIYQLHVKAFCDGDGDGVGDFKGLTGKLGYLQDLGVTAVWLLPFYPSPFKDDGYDISDYRGIHPAYGTMGDFKTFLREAHRRGLRVITELVINHTSDQHPWFRRARRSRPGSKRRDFYVWSDTPDRYKDARIIFQDFETSNWAWDPVAGAYYWHRFFSHQPDLNFDNPQVQKEVIKVMDFWFDMGVDGLRLDAVPYLFEREGTNCENLPETHRFLRKLRAHVDAVHPGRMLLGEANQWPEDAVAYFGRGDECHMSFHFPLMPRLFMALRMEDRFPIVDILDQTPALPDACQWAVFLRNHDELTLEMVTDEERDYMYKAYAQDPQMRLNLGIRRRLAPLAGNHRRRIELMNSLLFSLPGTPIIYYGDELGMGDNIYLGDRNGVRTPMQWSAGKNAGFSQANPQRLYLPLINDPEYHYETYNVEAQQNNPHSLLWWMKHLIAVRKRLHAFGNGTLEFLTPDNNKVLAFIRSHEEQHILVVANLSRFIQYANLDLNAYKGTVPVEVIGRTHFPPIGDTPYFLTLSPHSFFWFTLESVEKEEAVVDIEAFAKQLPVISVTGGWESVFEGQAFDELERILPQYLKLRRWFRGKARAIRSISFINKIIVPFGARQAVAGLARAKYMDGDEEVYLLPLTYAPVRDGEEIADGVRNTAVACLKLDGGDEKGMLYDAFMDGDFYRELLNILARRRRLRGPLNRLQASVTPEARRLLAREDVSLEPRVLAVEQSNSSVAYGETFILKAYRRLDFGTHPDLEIGSFLMRKRFEHVPRVYGRILARMEENDPATIAVLQEYIPNQGDALSYTRNSLGSFIESVLTLDARTRNNPPPVADITECDESRIPKLVSEMAGPYAESVRLLGRRTAELHLVLSSDPDNPAFSPETLSALSQRAMYQSMRNMTITTFQTLRRTTRRLPKEFAPIARSSAECQAQVLEYFRRFKEHRIPAVLIRCHGDYHLGQVLFTGKDFVIIDFEGQPSKGVSERRRKRSPFTDVAGMIRSFGYVSYSALEEHAAIRTEDVEILRPWMDVWRSCMSAVFLKSYLDTAGSALFIPGTREELDILLKTFLMEKAVSELSYELDHRPDRAALPLRGIKDMLKKS